ncbi:tectonin beta-propeller repeat-containing protein 1, partial [Lates japonicus]
VWFREGIYHQNPEGSLWEEVSLPGEVVQISCGPGDLVWAALWEGQLIVREGIGRDCPKGTSWAVVDSPSPDVGAIHVAVGVNVVWAVTKDNKVWFRRGVNSHNPSGSGWISMVGEMIMVNVGLNDQVWGISCEDRAVYFRQGVTSSELSGKTWKPTDTPKPRIPKVTSDSFISELVSDREPAKTIRNVGSAAPAVLVEETVPGEGEVKAPCTDVALSPTQSGGPLDPQWSNVDLEEAQGQQAQTAAVLESADTCSLSSVATYTLAMEDPYGADEHPLWAWVSGGGCFVDSHSQLSWFNCTMNTSSLVQSVQSMSLSVTPAQTAAWRRQIFEQLSERTKREMDNFRHYEQAIEQSVWVKKGTMQWWRDWKPHKWIDVHFALEQFSGPEGNKDGILFIYYNFYEEKKYLHAFINEVTILVPVINDSKHTFAIYTPERTKQRWPIRLAAATELEMHDWLLEGLLPGLQQMYYCIHRLDIKSTIYEPEVEPLPGYTNRGLPTDRYMWSDASGLHECTKTNTKPPSPLSGHGVSDWAIYHSASGGTDERACNMQPIFFSMTLARNPPIPLSDGPSCRSRLSSVDVVPLWAISSQET